MNSLLLSVKAGCAEVYVGKISSLLSCGNDPLLREARKLFSNAKRQREWASSRALVRSVKGRAIPITYDAKGRPCIEGSQLSISHSGDYVAVALSKGCRVGVDIQVPHPHLLQLEPRICNPRERAALSPDPKVRAEQLLTVWSLKESYYKASVLEFFDIQGITVGNGQLAIGNEQLAMSNEQLAIGNEQLAISNEQLAIGNEQLAIGNEQLAIGNEQLAIGNEQLAIGNEQLTMSDEQLTFVIGYSLLPTRLGWVWRRGEFVLTLVEWR